MPGALADAEWIRRLPKAEVHLHLEGCIDAEVLAAAAARQGLEPGAGGAPRITDLAQLLSHLDLACALITEPDELAAIAYQTARRSAASGTRHIDVIANPSHWKAFADRPEAMLAALDAGFRDAEADGFATAVLCLSLKRQQSRTEALHFVEWMVDRRHPRVRALSIDGDESAGSHNERFAEAFARAAEAGFHRCAHAGESSGADGVREAIELLGVERIDHGIAALDDPGVVAELVRRSIPLDVCPTSNVVLGVVASIAEHPVVPLSAAGVTFSLNTDDPVLYEIDLAGEYARCAAAFGWDRAALAAIARTSIDSCFADDDRRNELRGELDAFLSTGG